MKTPIRWIVIICLLALLALLVVAQPDLGARLQPSPALDQTCPDAPGRLDSGGTRPSLGRAGEVISCSPSSVSGAQGVDTSAQGKNGSAGARAYQPLTILPSGFAGAMRYDVIIYSSGGNPASAKDRFQTLINQDNIDMIIGPTLDEEAVAAYPVAQAAGVPVLGVSLAGDKLTDGKYIFSDALPASVVAPQTVQQVLGNQTAVHKIAVLYNADSLFSTTERDAYVAAFPNRSPNLEVIDAPYHSQTVDFETQITAIKNAKPDALVISALDKQATEILVQLQQADLSSKLLRIGGSGFNSLQVLRDAGSASNGLVVGGAWNAKDPSPQNQDFIAAFKRRFNKDPDQFAAQGYAAIEILAEAIARGVANNGTTNAATDTRQTIQYGLLNMKRTPVTTVLGKLSFDDKGNAVGTPIVQVACNGQLDLLHDPLATCVPSVGLCRTFTETSKTVCGAFLDYWYAHGGLLQQGFPLSGVFTETSDLDAGKSYTVQYFERSVFEEHPENKPPYDILLAQLGTYRYNTKYKAKYGEAGAPDQKASTDNPTTFKETGMTLGGKFRAYWDKNGGLPRFGYPISNEFLEASNLDAGKTYLVQYFERVVMELHPENAGTPYEVLLAQLGTYRFKDKKYSAP